MSWVSPLVGYENAEPLPNTFNPDGKSLYNPLNSDGPDLSPAYTTFPEPIRMTNNAFDFHGKLLSPFNSIANLLTRVDSLLHAGRSRASKVCLGAPRTHKA